jgi:hypothetical protein
MEEAKSGEQMKLLRLLLRQGCAHRFSWPRSNNNGRHYQICLACGAAYEYDWQIMRRTNRPMVKAIAGELRGSSLSR